MASVSGVTMSIVNGSSSTARNVTVKGTLTFDASDVGRTYHLSIGLFGEDKSDDKLPAGDPVGDDQIYGFLWSGFPLPKSYKAYPVAAPGTVVFAETRSVANTKLDEDPGTWQPAFDPDHGQTPPPPMPRRDEVYARATLAVPTVSARSSTVIAGFGV
jgi:hypothetical protein